jgi:hypothetical protein
MSQQYERTIGNTFVVKSNVIYERSVI